MIRWGERRARPAPLLSLWVAGQRCLSPPRLPRPSRWLLLAERCAAPLLSQCCVNLLAQFLISAAKGRSLLTPMALLQSDHR